MKPYYVYIMGNKNGGKFQIDVTDNLVRTLSEKEEAMSPKVKKMYSKIRLVYFEEAENIFNAVKIKTEFEKWNKVCKMILIDKFNPGWNDLFLELLFESNKETKN